MTINSSLSTVSPADLQAAVIALIQQNNVELKQLMSEALLNLVTVKPKKQQKSTQNRRVTSTKTRVAYSEMPFWKANPHLKPAVKPGLGLKKEVFEAAQIFFQDPEYPITDAWFEMLD